MNRGRLAAALLATAFASSPLTAQTLLTLETAQVEARGHAPDVAELDALVRGAEAVAAQAARRFRQNPEASGSVGPGALVGRPDELSWNVGVALPVDVSGSREPRAASANADLAHAQRNRDDGLRALDERVALAFAEVALQQRLVARLERMSELQQIAADSAHRQLDVGQGTQLEADSADLDLASARVLLEQSRGDLAGTRARLARLLGRRATTDFTVADVPEQPVMVEAPDFDGLIDRDPRVLAVTAELDSAKFEQQMFARLATPAPTFGLAYGYQRRDIPSGSFNGTPLANSLSALWSDRELTFDVTVGLPFFDRQQEPHAKATARVLVAEARLQMTRADVRSELVAAWDRLLAASRALQAVSPVSATIDRDITFVEQAVRAGAFDAVQRTQALRRLVESGRIADTTTRDFRAARAAWIRRAGL